MSYCFRTCTVVFAVTNIVIRIARPDAASSCFLHAQVEFQQTVDVLFGRCNDDLEQHFFLGFLHLAAVCHTPIRHTTAWRQCHISIHFDTDHDTHDHQRTRMNCVLRFRSAGVVSRIQWRSCLSCAFCHLVGFREFALSHIDLLSLSFTVSIELAVNLTFHVSCSAP